MYYYLLLLLPVLLFSGWASMKVQTTFSAYNKEPNSSRMTGYDTAVTLMRNRGVGDISVNRVKGTLSDHYHPTKKQVNLSESTFGNASVASVAVAAHEIGHVMQKKEGYLPYKLRNLLVPVTNFGSRFALPLCLIGVLIDLFATTDIGYYLVLGGIGLYGLSTLFALVTLPVEFNASRRAKKMLVSDGVLTKEEVYGAERVLSAAALTYVASLAVSLVYFLRFALLFLSLTGGRRRR